MEAGGLHSTCGRGGTLDRLTTLPQAQPLMSGVPHQVPCLPWD